MESTKVVKSRKKVGGRVAGTPNKKNAETQARVAASGLTPLEFMLSVMRGEAPEGADPAQKLAFHMLRFDAAKAAAPYVHPKLSSVDATVEHTGNLFDSLLKSIDGSALKVVRGEEE